MRRSDVRHVREEPAHGVARLDWKANPHDVLEQLDKQLAIHGLEVVLVDYDGDSVVWCLRKRVEEK